MPKKTKASGKSILGNSSVNRLANAFSTSQNSVSAGKSVTGRDEKDPSDQKQVQDSDTGGNEAEQAGKEQLQRTIKEPKPILRLKEGAYSLYVHIFD